MPDVSGYRAKWGIIIPSTNTTTEHDFWFLAPPGITIHSGRALISDPRMDSNEAAVHVLDQMDAGFDHAVAEVNSLLPDRVILAMAAEVMRHGVAGGDAILDDLAQRTGVPVTAGPNAAAEALETLGAHKIALLTPYQPGSDAISTAYFIERGFDVVNVLGLRCATAHAIAQLQPEAIVGGLRELDGPDVEAFLAIGTAVPIVRLVDQAEHWLGKPVIAMNTATVWSALRHSGFDDKIPAGGLLVREY
jgi:maleate isomerase